MYNFKHGIDLENYPDEEEVEGSDDRTRGDTKEFE
jgi:hypothetical protein